MGRPQAGLDDYIAKNPGSLNLREANFHAVLHALIWPKKYATMKS